MSDTLIEDKLSKDAPIEMSNDEACAWAYGYNMALSVIRQNYDLVPKEKKQ